MSPSTKPYFIRAIYEWCNDGGFTPYLSVSVDARTRVPRAYVKEGQIVLNIGVDATQGLVIGNDEIRFQARFNGVAQALVIPVDRVTAIYARENGQGMAFEVPEAQPAEDAEPGDQQPEGTAPTDEGPTPPAPPAGGRPHLTRIK
jgi:stringent starvation protein B